MPDFEFGVPGDAIPQPPSSSEVIAPPPAPTVEERVLALEVCVEKLRVWVSELEFRLTKGGW